MHSQLPLQQPSAGRRKKGKGLLHMSNSAKRLHQPPELQKPQKVQQLRDAPAAVITAVITVGISSASAQASTPCCCSQPNWWWSWTILTNTVLQMWHKMLCAKSTLLACRQDAQTKKLHAKGEKLACWDQKARILEQRLLKDCATADVQLQDMHAWMVAQTTKPPGQASARVGRLLVKT